MKEFKYIQPKNINEAISVMSRGSLPFAGGTDILSLMKENLIDHKNLVNLKHIDGFSEFAISNTSLSVIS